MPSPLYFTWTGKTITFTISNSTHPPLNPSCNRLRQSHLPALRDSNVRRRLLAPGPSIFDFPHHVHAVDHFAEHDMLVVQEGGRNGCDEELAPVGVGAGVLVVEGITLDVCARWGGKN